MRWDSLLAVLVLSSCDGMNAGPGAAPLIPKTPSISHAAAGPGPSDATIFPLAFLTMNTSSGQAHCMGGYFGDGKILTAAHCLANLGENACATGDLAIAWATKAHGGAESPGKSTACAHFRTSGSAAAKDDLAVVLLAADAVRPEDSLRFAQALPAEVVRVFVWGPPGEQGYFLIAVGGIFARTGDFLSHNAPVEPGFSGSPVFGIPDAATGATIADVLPTSLELGVIGVHLGYVGGVLTAVSASTARNTLDKLGTP